MVGESGIRATARPRVAEFFAGIGLVRLGLEQAGFDIVFANDIDPRKRALYVQNFGAADFVLGDVTNPDEVCGTSVPSVDLVTASFPCTDLSLAGNRAGLIGEQSGTFWGFARVLTEMGRRRPSLLMLENVPSLATSNDGQDLAAIIEALNGLGYACDMLVLDAKSFVPQSRKRLFIVGSRHPVPTVTDWRPSSLRPSWMSAFVAAHPYLNLVPAALPPTPEIESALADVVERLPRAHARWWDSDRKARFVGSLSVLNAKRLATMKLHQSLTWATAYRRTRNGVALWEIRGDDISGCLRTARGGSSKQALVEAGHGEVRVRWMTPVECARLQGADGFRLDSVSENQALFGLGDAVCSPVIRWLGENYLRPLMATESQVALFAHA